MNLRDKILNAKDIQFEEVDVPQWGVKVIVQGMSGKQRATYMQEVFKNSKNGTTMDFEKMYPELIIQTVLDPETFQPIFSRTDRDLLNQKSGAALEVLAQVAMRLSGLDPKATEELEKNSPNTPNEPSILS